MRWESPAKCDLSKWHRRFLYLPMRFPSNRLRKGQWVWWEWVWAHQVCGYGGCVFSYQLEHPVAPPKHSFEYAYWPGIEGEV